MDAIYIGLFRSLINHSCLPNVTFVSIDNKVVTVIKIPVKAGEQLFCSYYKTCNLDHAFQRALTMEMFGFECDCQKCIDRNNHSNPNKVVDPMSFTTRKNFETAKEILKIGWNVINTNAIPEILMFVISQNITTLSVIADFATFPC